MTHHPAPDLGLVGFQVCRVEVDYALGLLLFGGTPTEYASFRIDGLVTLRTPGGAAYEFDYTKGPAAFAPALSLFNQCVRRAETNEAGRLEMAFEDGHVLTVEPGQGYEAWDFNGPHGFKVIALPSGGLAVWDAEPPAERPRAALRRTRPGRR